MRAKKGFTLIELLAVIVILAIIALIATPIILKIVGKAGKSSLENTAYGIIKSGEYYYTENIMLGGTAEDKSIVLGEGIATELNFDGTIPNGMMTITKDGKVGIAIYDDKWCVSKSAYSSKVTVTEYEEGKCVIPDVAKDPVIILNGSKDIKIVENSSYVENGLVARTMDGEVLTYTTTITRDGVEVSTIDTSMVGAIYKITYRAEKNEKVAIEERTITIIDITNPVITVPENTLVYTIDVNNYDLLTDVVVIDNSGEKIVPTTSGTLSEIPGTYTVIYTATDSFGNSTTISRMFTVDIKNMDTAGANVPNLSNGLIPIKWNGSIWIRAHEKNPGDEYQWYDYGSQMWANAASVTEEYRDVPIGTEIPESAVKAYFVWIPRYEYQYTNLGTSYAGGTAAQPGEIKVNFVSGTPTTASDSSVYKMHPAFTFGDTELTGFWAGKFETSGTSTAPTIKPNLLPLKNQTISAHFTTSQKMSASGNSYGISESADAHMMKNSEWGAVAYLSQSKYGKYGNELYTGTNKQVYINNNSGYKTGCSGGSPSASSSSSCTYSYEKSPGGTGASTSGTIYGVYDMSGGAEEYVMGNYNSNYSSAGFGSLPDAKYYDKYTTTSAATACSGGVCYGHALSETRGWYSDTSGELSSSYPWYLRGKTYSETSNAGLFAYWGQTGYGSSQFHFAFRIAIL